MTTIHEGISLRTAAWIGGIGLLAMAILAPIAQFGLLANLILDGDAAATAAKIAESEAQFRIAIGCFLLVAVLDVVVAIALYVVFRPVNRFLSRLTAMVRIVYAAMFRKWLQRRRSSHCRRTDRGRWRRARCSARGTGRLPEAEPWCGKRGRYKWPSRVKRARDERRWTS